MQACLQLMEKILGFVLTLPSLSFWSGPFHPWIWTCPLLQIGLSDTNRKQNCKQCRSRWEPSHQDLHCLLKCFGLQVWKGWKLMEKILCFVLTDIIELSVLSKVSTIFILHFRTDISKQTAYTQINVSLCSGRGWGVTSKIEQGCTPNPPPPPPPHPPTPRDPLRKHAYSNILKFLQVKKGKFSDKKFLIFLLKT